MSKKSWTVLAIQTSILGAAFLAAVGGGLSDKGLNSETADFLKGEGYAATDVGGYEFAAGSSARLEIFSTKFSAVDTSGNEIKGVVVDGPFTAPRLIISKDSKVKFPG